MTLILEQTDRIVEVNGVPGRIWEGVTGRGVKVTALITRLAVLAEADCQQFESELLAQKSASKEAIGAFPLRLII